MRPRLAPYLQQRAQWPPEGRHILADYDDDSVVVYQAYRPSIGRYAVEHQRFGGEWSFSRMSWIKPNFLWMMYRCGWAQKPGQEVVLAIRMTRSGFDQILAQAVHSSYVAELYGSPAAWKQRLSASEVCLQWDPDHDPHGNKVARRAIQLGLRGGVLRDYATDWCLGIDDVSAMVAQQHGNLRDGLERLETPLERVYPVEDPEVIAHLGLSDYTG
ncbi:hypothetical protein DB30_04040 [Enhygromyxa salina]|uniref:DUF4291 domain-containing protein n=1 Tax=Enhygromyxa salina TaxID=215803 RepID=A0A0C2A0H5_9BACT|nr:DUF4291 domain-containing protein [Enhygromyxa salina]KIG16878.1 hypothetical protein DB30_04040 [Enhygromyxa salina]